MEYFVSNIEYDADDSLNLPIDLTIDVPSDLSDDEVYEYISDEITNITEYCHTGFSYCKNLK